MHLEIKNKILLKIDCALNCCYLCSNRVKPKETCWILIRIFNNDCILSKRYNMEIYSFLLTITCKTSIFSTRWLQPNLFLASSFFLYFHIVKSFTLKYNCLPTFTSFPVPQFTSYFYGFNLQGFPQEWSPAVGKWLTGIFGSRQIVPSRLPPVALHPTSFHNIFPFIMHTNKNSKLQPRMLTLLCDISFSLLSV